MEAAVKAVESIDWRNFLGKQDLLWESRPMAWEEGGFIGNGLLGAMIYGRGGQELVWDVGRTDVTMKASYPGSNPWSETPVNFRLPIGKMVLRSKGTIRRFTMRMNLWDAEITGLLETDLGEIRFRTLAHTKHIALLIERHCTGGEQDSALEWQPDPSRNPRRIVLKEEEPHPNPEPEFGSVGDTPYCLQRRYEGGGYATAWKDTARTSGSRLLVLSVADSYPGLEAPEEAAAAVEGAAAIPLDKLEQEHRDWWHAYYQKSYMSIPDARMEQFYWIQLYKIASGTRSDRPILDLLGPWFKLTRWPAIWWNLNIQLTYWPVYASNHLEIGESLIKQLDRCSDQLAANAGPYSEDSASISVITSYDCASAADDPSDLVWTLHNYWLHYRHCMDDRLLREGLYPLLRRAVNLYLHHLREGEDGAYHLPLWTSPEYPKQAEDTNYSLSLLTWGCRTLLWITERLDVEDPLRERWTEVLNKLTPFPVGENGFMIGKDVPYELSHRHFSHMIMIYPLNLIHWGQEENRELIAASLRTWMSKEEGMCGYSYLIASRLYMEMKDNEKAVSYLRRFLDSDWNRERSVVLPNTLYWEICGSGNMNPTMETPLAFAKMVQDLLLQSWGGKIRIFPGVPDSWSEASFLDFLAEGAFKVSAERTGGATRWVRIESLAGEPCVVDTGFAQGRIRIDTEAGTRYADAGDGELRLDLKQNETATLYPE